ncbi:MAG: malectin domain-containing carbohydrate-binding protein, partial [Myxococcota bacterium]
IAVLTVSRQFSTVGNVQVETWNVTDRYDISIVQDIPNHDDQGRYQANIGNRQVTGAVTTVDSSGNVMIYVTSSDPRVSVGTDTNLDTNSGVISRLTQQLDGNGNVVVDGAGNPVWERLDLVRGFPRSEENHAINGLELVTRTDGTQFLLVSVGGNTNAGAQGNNFSYTPEYFYSGSVVSVDLDALEVIELGVGPTDYVPAPGNVNPYLFDLPTLNDPTRGDDPVTGGDLDGDGFPTADVFGGNDGLNQAIFDATGIVELFGVGYRNQYDVTVTANGDVYTADNGSNGGWGGVPLNAAGQEIVDANNDGLADNGPAINLSNESGSVNKGDQLHLVGTGTTAPAYSATLYGGHPNFYRARGAAAGFFLYAANNNPYGVASGTPLDIVNGTIVATAMPTDVGSLIVNANLLTGLDAMGNPNIDPRQEVFQAPARQTGITNGPDGSLYSFQSSTNGIDEYAIPGGLQNTLLTVSFNGDITALHLDANGNVALAENRSLTSNPLDVIAQDVTDPYPGVIFVAAYGADQIVILSPDQGQGVVPNPNDRDLDGIDDTFDPYAVDPYNGYVDLVRSGDTFVWDFVLGPNSAPPNDSPAWFDCTGGLYAGGGIGFTGVMTNRQGLPESLVDPNNIIYGGAPGILQVKAVDEGDPGTNTQRNGFQFGINPVSTLTSFEVTSMIDNFIDEIGNLPPTAEARQGLFVGAGDQDNYIAVQLTRRSNGDVGFEVESQFAFAFVGATPVQVDWYPVPALNGVTALDDVQLGLDVDRGTGMVTPKWTYWVNGVATSGTGTAVGLTGDAWDALQGVLMLPTDSGGVLPSGFAVGFLSSVSGAGTESFQADFDDLAISGFGPGAGPLVTAVNAGGLQYTALDGTVFLEDLFNNGNAATTSAPIAGTDDDAIFQSERWAAGGFTYDIPVSNGSYLVEMYFAETYPPNFAAGLRVFDVLLEGQVVYDDLDVFAEAGAGDTALIKTELVSVTDGMLTLTTTPETQNPQINGFAIYEFTLDTQDPTVSVTYDTPVVFDDPLGVTVAFTDDQQLDNTSIDLTDVTFSTTGQPLQILNSQLIVSGSGGQAYAEFEIRPVGGWNGETVTVDVAAGVFQDAAGNPNAAFSDSSFTFTGSANPVVFAVNCGNQGAYTASNGIAYAADGFGNGNNFSIGRPIAGTSDPTIYQSERWSNQTNNGPLVYEFPVANGTYLLQLEFAEIFNGITAPGQRVMDVSAEGQLLFDDFDMFAEAGGIDIAISKRAVVEVTDGLFTIEIAGVVENPKLSAFAVLNLDAEDVGPLSAFLDPTAQPLIDTTDAVGGLGEVLVEVLPGSNNVQASNFGNNSWTIDNLGTKRIAAVYLDVSTALFRDAVFDDDGTGGDQVTKPLTFSNGSGAVLPVDPATTPYNNLFLPARDSSTFNPLAAFAPGQLGDVDNLFVDQVSNNALPSPKAGGGFRGQLLIFDDFDGGELVGFSSDMDPNSIAGLTKSSVDSASNPAGSGGNFDVGGIGGAELAGSTITVLFGDGSIASAQLGHDGSQAGAHAFIETSGPATLPTADLMVDGFVPGDAGAYGVDRPEVIVSGSPGDTIRVSMVKAFDPVGNTATVASGAITIDSLVGARLQAQYPDFPVSNAVEWQHIDVVIPASGVIDITYGFGGISFDYVEIDNSIAGADDFPGDDILPIAFVASVIDTQGRPLGPVTSPITLVNQGGPAVCEDQDADGVSTCAGDCDDLDPTVFPGQVEVCDAIDNDCDGTIDGASAVDVFTWYADGDGDGFGDPNVSQDACVQPANFVLDDTDCDDLIASINPNGIEVCDTLDNDCDGTVDGPDSTDALTFYADSDGDGFGDASVTAFDCAAPAGFVADATDCDDSTSTVSPGNPELCNGFDDNCDGQTDDSSSADAVEYFADSDGDTYGDPLVSQFA